jgi:hypothetical protein
MKYKYQEGRSKEQGFVAGLSRYFPRGKLAAAFVPAALHAAGEPKNLPFAPTYYLRLFFITFFFNLIS